MAANTRAVPAALPLSAAIWPGSRASLQRKNFAIKFPPSLLALLLAAPCSAAPAIVPIAKANAWTGNYLFTMMNAMPPSANGETLCLTVNQTGGILGVPASGTWTTPSLPLPGQFIQQGQRLIFLYADASQSIFVETAITDGTISAGYFVLGAPTTEGGVSLTSDLRIAAAGC
jgi:hypothetical protein